MIAFQLHESRTHKLRRYAIAAVPGTCAVEALLSIKLGEVGPRGGTSKMRWETYHVVEPLPDPDEPHDAPGERQHKQGRTFWVVKLGDTPPNVPSIPDDPDEVLYEVHIPIRPTVGYCTCKGWAMGHVCKHYDTFEHLVNVVGMGKGFVVEDSVERIACCGLAGCDLCYGKGYVEVESASEWGYWS